MKTSRRKSKAKSPKTKSGASCATPPDREVEIERLAALELIDYEVARMAAAKRLGIVPLFLITPLRRSAALSGSKPVMETTARAAP